MFKSLLVAVTAVTAVFASVAPALGVDPDSAAGTAASNARRAADWRQFRGGADHRGVNRYETALSTTTVGGLELQWVGNNGFNSSPAVANGVLYVSNGGLHAYPADCGTGGLTCSPLWTGNSGFANWSSPAVGDGYVYISGSNGLSAYKVGCRNDGGVCAHRWRDASAVAHFSSATYSNGMVFLSTNAGWLNAYDAEVCNNVGGGCLPTWKANLGGLAESSPAVADGIVYIASPDGYLNAFLVGCGTGGSTCNPIWRGNMHGASVASPAVAGGAVYIGTHGGQLFAFPTSCRNTGPVCNPLWKAVLPGIIHASAAVTDTTVYIPAHKRLYAFGVGCASNGNTCDPLWMSGKIADQGSTLASSPAVANGVVYLGTQTNSTSNGRLLAFPAECGDGGAVCHNIWKSALLGGIVNPSPAVTHGMVYVASNSGKTYAFGLD